MEHMPAITIDWPWVRSHLSSRERIGKIGEESTKKSIHDAMENAIDIVKAKAQPKISFSKRDILRLKPGSIELSGGLSLSTKELSKHINGATHVWAFLVTIGSAPEEAATRAMNSGDHLLGYLLDRAGSFAVESMAKNAEEAMRNTMAEENLSVSMRFSPGYCDWPIEEQFKMAELIDFEKIGVTLTKNCMMVPKKTISALVGIGPKELFAEVKSPCSLCNMKVCDYRRND